MQTATSTHSTILYTSRIGILCLGITTACSAIDSPSSDTATFTELGSALQARTARDPGSAKELALTAEAPVCRPGQAFCDEPESGTLPLASEVDLVPTAEFNERGDQVLFSTGPKGSWVAQLVVPLTRESRAVDDTYAEVVQYGQRVRIITNRTPSNARKPRGVYVLDAGKQNLDDVTLVLHLQLEPRASETLVGPTALSLQDSTGAEVSQTDFEPVLAAPPSTCLEHALVRFGPIPWNMSPIHVPEIEDCSGEECIQVVEGWIRGHHHSWRVLQMFLVLDQLPEYQRDFFWGQPALDDAGNPVGLAGSDTSPQYWFGGYTEERYWAIREGVMGLWGVLATAETCTVNVHLQCPEASQNPGNICFSSSSYGHHSVIGWVNVCSEGFNDAVGLYDNDQDAVTHTVIHESSHHLTVQFDAGGRLIRDLILHGHGHSCADDLQNQFIDGREEVRHLATYVAPDGEGCWHRNYAAQSVEAYTNFAMRIGEGVRDGELHRWPQPGTPTPQAPDCVGDIGCRCEDVPFNEAPDGDAAIDQYCFDTEEEPTTCMNTEFGAGDVVGICTHCATTRGPGCPCDDFDQPCDRGFCWGDDTGPGNVTGRCFDDPPPSWACLANCEALLGTGAFCMYDHPQGARCVPTLTSHSDAESCWNQGRFINADSECVRHECGPDAGNFGQDVSCQDLGYPEYFYCGDAFRCMPAP